MSDFSKLMRADDEYRACNCIGPQPGHTLCPCMEAGKMREELAFKERLIREGWKPPGSAK